MKRKYTEAQFVEAISTSQSLAQAFKKLNLEPQGGNYRTAQKYIKELGLDTSHMTGQLWSKGKTIGPKRPIEDYLSNKYYIHSHALRKRLIKEKLFFEVCSLCCLKTWLNKPIPLELHHKDGDHRNNNITNLQLLCPNCHSLTDNYRGKSLKEKRQNKNKIELKCIECSTKISNGCTRCKKCNDKLPKPYCRKVQRPSKEELESLVWSIPTSDISKQLGDIAISKWCKTYGITKPPRGYWAKLKSTGDRSCTCKSEDTPS